MSIVNRLERKDEAVVPNVKPIIFLCTKQPTVEFLMRLKDISKVLVVSDVNNTESISKYNVVFINMITQRDYLKHVNFEDSTIIVLARSFENSKSKWISDLDYSHLIKKLPDIEECRDLDEFKSLLFVQSIHAPVGKIVHYTSKLLNLLFQWLK